MAKSNGITIFIHKKPQEDKIKISSLTYEGSPTFVEVGDEVSFRAVMQLEKKVPRGYCACARFMIKYILTKEDGTTINGRFKGFRMCADENSDVAINEHKIVFNKTGQWDLWLSGDDYATLYKKSEVSWC